MSAGGGGGTGAVEGCRQIDSSSYDYSENVAPSQSPPGGRSPNEVPMFVSIGWDDNGYSGLDGSAGTGAMDWAVKMLAARKHMDGSPVYNTFYLTSVYGNTWMSESPTFVKRAWHAAYEGGHEIGLHTDKHDHGSTFDATRWNTEMQKPIDLLTASFDPSEDNFSPDVSKGVGVPRGDIVGFRTPFLEYDDALFDVLKQHKMFYDTSIEEGWQPEQDGTNYNWPFTLDNGAPAHDLLVEWGTKTEPLKGHPGLWEMPVYPLVVPPDSVASQYGIQPGLRAKLHALQSWFDEDSGKITGFDYNLWVSFKLTKAEFVATLKYSLDLRLQGNRAPFMLGAHTDYYSSKYTAPENATTQERQEAIEEFLDYALSKPEVRVVAVKDILTWVRSCN